MPSPETDMAAEEKTANDEAGADEAAAAGKDEPENGNNLAMWKLLRGPRYFDPQQFMDSRCYNCGETGHSSRECTEERRVRPCYVCGELGHEGRDCPLGKVCFVCQEKGHVARNCPNKRTLKAAVVKGDNPDELCMKCGYRGHSRQTCKEDYDPEDMKVVRCYICKKEGHLSCLSVKNDHPPQLTCCKCGDRGHAGEGCPKSTRKQKAGEIMVCFTCGEDGHFARNCQKANNAPVCRICNRAGHLARHCLKQRMELACLNQESTMESRRGWEAEDGGDLRSRLSIRRRGASTSVTPETNHAQRRRSWPEVGLHGKNIAAGPGMEGERGHIVQQRWAMEERLNGVNDPVRNGGWNELQTENWRIAPHPTWGADVSEGLFRGDAGKGRGWEADGDASHDRAGTSSSRGNGEGILSSRKRKMEMQFAQQQGGGRALQGGVVWGGAGLGRNFEDDVQLGMRRQQLEMEWQARGGGGGGGGGGAGSMMHQGGGWEGAAIGRWGEASEQGFNDGARQMRRRSSEGSTARVAGEQRHRDRGHDQGGGGGAAAYGNRKKSMSTGKRWR